jgi:hypothetical protein
VEGGGPQKSHRTYTGRRRRPGAHTYVTYLHLIQGNTRHAPPFMGKQQQSARAPSRWCAVVTGWRQHFTRCNRCPVSAVSSEGWGTETANAPAKIPQSGGLQIGLYRRRLEVHRRQLVYRQRSAGHRRGLEAYCPQKYARARAATRTQKHVSSWLCRCRISVHRASGGPGLQAMFTQYNNEVVGMRTVRNLVCPRVLQAEPDMRLSPVRLFALALKPHITASVSGA